MTPAKLVLGAERQLHQHGVGAQVLACSCSTNMSKSAPTRSILLMKQMRGTLYLSAWRQTVSDCGSTPFTAHRTQHGAVEHAQRALHLDGEVHVARRVDDVDAVLWQSTCPCPSRRR